MRGDHNVAGPAGEWLSVQTTNFKLVFCKTAQYPAVAKLSFDVMLRGKVGDELALLMADSVAAKIKNRDNDLSIPRRLQWSYWRCLTKRQSSERHQSMPG